MNDLNIHTDLWTELIGETRPLMLYGMGNGTDKLIARLKAMGLSHADVFASDEFVRGQHFHGRRVLTLAEAEHIYGDFTVLVGFATTLQPVIDRIVNISRRHPLYIPDMPAYGEEYFDIDFFTSHRGEMEKVYDMLADDSSRDLYISSIEGKLTGLPQRVLANTTDPSHKYGLLHRECIQAALDCGAYRGDTADEMCRHFLNLNEILAVEPDKKTFAKLLEYASAASCSITAHNCALSDHIGTTVFDTKGNRGSSLSVSGVSVDLTTVDELCRGRAVDYIKYDVEGFEYPALVGSRRTIELNRPQLSVSLYHRAEDMFTLPLLLCDMCPEYDFYLHRRRCLPVWELDMIAIPKERK